MTMMKIEDVRYVQYLYAYFKRRQRGLSSTIAGFQGELR